MNLRTTDVLGNTLPAGFMAALQDPKTKPTIVMKVDFTGTGTMVTVDPSRITGFTLDDVLTAKNGFACANSATITLDNHDKAFSPQRYTLTYDPATLQYNGTKQSDGRGNLRPWRRIYVGFTIPAYPSNEIPLINGTIDSTGFSEKMGKDNDNIVTLKIVDLSKKLIDKKGIGTDVVGSNDIDIEKGFASMKICDPADTGNSIVHLLACVYGGISPANVVCQTIPIVVDYFRIDKDLWTELALLADSVLGVVFFDNDKLYFGDSPFASGGQTTKAFSFTNDHFIGLDSSEQFDSIKNKIKLNYGSYKKLGQQALWMFNNTDPLSGYLNPSYTFDPTGATDRDLWDPTRTYFCKYQIFENTPVTQASMVSTQDPSEAKDTSTEVVKADNVVLESNVGSYTGDNKIALFNTTTKDSGAIIRFVNSGSPFSITQFRVVGEPYVKGTSKTSTFKDANSITTYGEKVEEYENKFITQYPLTVAGYGTDQEHQKIWGDSVLAASMKPKLSVKFSLGFPMLMMRAGMFVDVSETKQSNDGLPLMSMVNGLVQRASFSMDGDTWKVELTVNEYTGIGSPTTPSTIVSTTQNSRSISAAMAQQIAQVRVSGQTSFTFDVGQSVPNQTTIVLSAALYGGLTTFDWEYWNGSSWVDLGGTQNASTYSLTYNQSEWGTNAALQIRCVSGSYSDTITIIKLYASVAGESALVGYLSNPYAQVLSTYIDPTTQAVLGNEYTGTSIYVNEGATQLVFVNSGPVAGQFTVGTPVQSPAAFATMGAKTGTGTVKCSFADMTAVAVSGGTITFPISGLKLDGTSFSLSLVQTIEASADGILSRITPSVNAIIRSRTGQLVPPTVNATAWHFSAARTPTATFSFAKIIGSSDGILEDGGYVENTSRVSQTSSYTPGATDKFVIFKMFNDAGLTVMADKQVIPIIADGPDAYTIEFLNEACVVPCDSAGANGDYSGTGMTLKVYNGSQLVALDTNDATYLDNTWRISSAVGSGITAGGITQTHGATSASIGIASAMTLDTATVTITLVIKNRSGVETTFTKVQSISKSYDGATGSAGNNAVSASITNDNVTIACNGSGVALAGGYDQTGLSIQAFEGSTALTIDNTAPYSNSSFRVGAPTGSSVTPGVVTQSQGATTATAAIASALVANSGSIDFAITIKNSLGVETTITKRQTFSKAYTGAAAADGTTYYTTSSVGVLKRTLAPIYQPTTIALSAFAIVGAGLPQAYAGKWVVAEYNGSIWTDRYTSSANEATKTYTPFSATGISAIRIRLYKSITDATLLYEDGIPVVDEIAGTTGANGYRTATRTVYQWAAAAPTVRPTGTASYTWATQVWAGDTLGSWTVAPAASVAGQTLWAVDLIASDNTTAAATSATWASQTVYAAGGAGSNGSTPAAPLNYQIGSTMMALSCLLDGTVNGAQSITIPFSGWQGTTRLAATIAYSGLPTGCTLGTNTPATSSADGSLVLNFASGSNPGSVYGEWNLTVTVSGTAFADKGRYAKAITGATGGAGTPGANAPIGGRNLLQNSDFSAPSFLTGWVPYQWTTGGATYSNSVDLGSWTIFTNSNAQSHTAYHTSNIAANVVSDFGYYNDMRPNIIPSTRYEAFAYFGAHRCKAGVTIEWYTSAMAYISASIITPTACGSGGGTLDGYTKVGGFVTAPSNAALAIFSIHAVTANGDGVSTGNPYLFVTQCYFGMAPDTAQTVLSPWSPAFIGVVRAGMVQALSITATEIATGTITTAKLISTALVWGQEMVFNNKLYSNNNGGTFGGTGVYMDQSGQLSLGSKLSFTGGNLTVNGNFKLSGVGNYFENADGTIRITPDISGTAFGDGIVMVSNTRAYVDGTAIQGDLRRSINRRLSNAISSTFEDTVELFTVSATTPTVRSWVRHDTYWSGGVATAAVELGVVNAKIRVASGQLHFQSSSAGVEGGFGLIVVGGNWALYPYTTALVDLGDATHKWKGAYFSGTVSAGTISATTLTGTLSTAAQTSITSVGTLTSLNCSGTITAGSNRAIKENIHPFNGSALDIINKTDIVRFTRKLDPFKAQAVGFIADDTDSIMSGESHDKMDLYNCIGILMKAVQELSLRLEIMEAE